MLMESVPPPLRASLHTHAVRFEEFELPPCDLIWAGYSLPFCPAAHWPRVWNSLVEALRPEGRFAGDLFGDQHAWATASDIHVLTEDALRRQLEGLMIEAFDIENGVRPSGGILTRWHAFGVAVRKTNASAG